MGSIDNEYIEKNKDLWAFDRTKHNLKYPDENVIRFLNRKYGKILDRSKISVMDFGCGIGRNTTVMADMGFMIYAVDYNEECLKMTSDKIKEYGVEYKLIYNDGTDIPLEDESVDAIVAWGALFYLDRNKEKDLLCELRRVLKAGGMILADYRTKEDSMYGKGEELERDFYILDQSCGSLAGISYAFRDISELFSIYARCGLNLVEYEKINRYTNNMQEINSHYVILATKPKDTHTISL